MPKTSDSDTTVTLNGEMAMAKFPWKKALWWTAGLIFTTLCSGIGWGAKVGYNKYQETVARIEAAETQHRALQDYVLDKGRDRDVFAEKISEQLKTISETQKEMKAGDLETSRKIDRLLMNQRNISAAVGINE
jgi:hypothetical protein